MGVCVRTVVWHIECSPRPTLTHMRAWKCLVVSALANNRLHVSFQHFTVWLGNGQKKKNKTHTERSKSRDVDVIDTPLTISGGRIRKAWPSVSHILGTIRLIDLVTINYVVIITTYFV